MSLFMMHSPSVRDGRERKQVQVSVIRWENCFSIHMHVVLLFEIK
jgi:hypothetical protein